MPLKVFPSLRRLAAILLFVASTFCLAQSPGFASSDPGFASSDLGPAPPATLLHRVQLVLKRSPQQEQALAAFMTRQQDPASLDYHRWLTPSSFGEAFGPSRSDLARLSQWLAAQGFTAIRINAGRTLAEFSATAGALEQAFHPGLHAYTRPGSASLFYVSMNPAQIPAEIAALVSGLAPSNPTPRPAYTQPGGASTFYGITPYDFATIYDVLPLWSAATPIDGTGQTIAIVGDTDINPADFVAFRTLFALPLGNTATSTGTQFLNIIYNGPKPDVLQDEAHADADTQWASAVAKDATIDYVASQSTEASSGNDLSAAYIVDNNLAAILVDSYAPCEAALGASGNAFYNALWQQAAAQGITVVAATGDSGSAACDVPRGIAAYLGKAVSGTASTPWNVAVGGTQFASGASAFFNPTNDPTHASATGYIPEVVWNDTCTDPSVLALPAYAGLTPEQVCNTYAAAIAGYAAVAGSGGGASTLYAKPSWQASPGVPADGHRDVPDVALFASPGSATPGRNTSAYVVCRQSGNAGGKPCNLAPPYADYATQGGTELATPAFAGILALVAQQSAGRLGNPNPTLYALAASQYSASGPAVFHDITTGTNAMPCLAGSPGCVTANTSSKIGILSVPSATSGYDPATGLGSVDAAALVRAWPTIHSAASAAVLSITPSSILHGAPITASVQVTGAGTPTGAVAIAAQAANGAVGFGQLNAGVYTHTFRNFPGGTYGVRAHYAGDSANAPTDSNFVSLTVAPEPSSTTLRPLSYDPFTGLATPVANTPYGDIFYIRADVLGQSGQGIATGDIALTDNGALLGSGVARLNSSGYAEAQNNSIVPGTHVFAASYSGDASFNPSAAPSATVTITRAPITASVTASPATFSAGSTVTLSAVLNTQSFGFLAPAGTLTFSSGGNLVGASTLLAGSDPVTFRRNATAVLTLPGNLFAVGSAGVSVAYAGDTNYLPATSSATAITITPTTLVPTVTSVFASPASVPVTGAITFTASVAPASPQPTGTVQFILDGQNTGPLVPVSQPTLTTSVATLKPGPHTVTAVYSGDLQNFRSSASLPAGFTVTAPGLASVPNITVTPTTAVQGTYIAVAVHVTALSGATSPAATGTAQLVLDGSLYGASFPLANASVVLPFTTSTIQPGPHVLTVFYSGDATFAPSYVTPVTVTITAPGGTPSATTLGGLPAQSNLGSALVFTASASPINPAPTGIFQILLDGQLPGAPILLTGPATTLTIPAASLPLGPHTIAVFYSGDATYNVSTSAIATITVVPPVFKGSFTITPATTAITTSRVQPSPTLVLTVVPSGGFVYPVSFACATLPANVTCTFAPAIVPTAAGANPVTTLTLNLNTGLKAAGSRPSTPTETAAAILAGILSLAFRRKRGRLPYVLALACLAALFAPTGCGSGYAPGTTLPGTYAITVIATGPASTQTATVTLIVN